MKFTNVFHFLSLGFVVLLLLSVGVQPVRCNETTDGFFQC